MRNLGGATGLLECYYYSLSLLKLSLFCLRKGLGSLYRSHPSTSRTVVYTYYSPKWMSLRLGNSHNKQSTSRVKIPTPQGQLLEARSSLALVNASKNPVQGVISEVVYVHIYVSIYVYPNTGESNGKEHGT